MRKSIAESITSTVKDLNKSGLVDAITMKTLKTSVGAILCDCPRKGQTHRSAPTKMAENRINPADQYYICER